MLFRSQYEEAAERRQGINKAVASDVQEVFRGKSADQLAQLQKQIEKKLRERLVIAPICFTGDSNTTRLIVQLSNGI